MKFHQILSISLIISNFCDGKPNNKTLSDLVKPHQIKEEILNGKVVDITKHPYQIALLSTRSEKIICGGVIIKPRVVFTAAHCTHNTRLKPRPNLAVLAGANHIDDDEGTVHKIARVIKHPAFSYSGLKGDISILLLKNPIKFSDKAKAIRISTQNHPGGTTAIVSGWGLTESGKQSRTLRAVEVKLDNHRNCQRHFPGPFHPTITQDMVCLKPHHKGAYYGDSGGPLTVKGKLVGLVSFGRAIDRKRKTAVFTKVGNFKEFIDTVVPDEYKDE